MTTRFCQDPEYLQHGFVEELIGGLNLPERHHPAELCLGLRSAEEGLVGLEVAPVGEDIDQGVGPERDEHDNERDGVKGARDHEIAVLEQGGSTSRARRPKKQLKES